jgi:hypothetical protein
MVIGLVVHASHRPRFEEAARMLKGVTLAWAIYEREDEIRDRVARLLAGQHVDGILLGLVPYAQARDLLPADLPVTVTRSAALDLALAWCRARGNGWPATPVSIDTFDTETAVPSPASRSTPTGPSPTSSRSTATTSRAPAART